MNDTKPVRESEIITYKIAMPEDSNPSPRKTNIMERPNINGGAILNFIDNVCGISALRHCRTRVVTASIDAMEFLYP
ncbi:MAG: hotdog domain-containing protein, partial [Candidatus Hodarchaeales archaeon]